jgi:hypothetical protein
MRGDPVTCSEDWNTRVMDYMNLLMEYRYGDLIEDQKGDVVDVHTHFWECEQCKKGYNVLKGIFASDSSLIGTYTGEHFRRLRENEESLDRILE